MNKFNLYYGRITLLCLLLLFSLSCDHKDVNPASQSEKEITQFTLAAKDNPQLLNDVQCFIQSDKIFGRVLFTNINGTTPSLDTTVVVKYTTTGVSVKVDSVEQEPGRAVIKINKPVTLTVEAADRSVKSYTVQLLVSTGLPVLYINTENAAVVTSKDVYLTGSVFIDASLENSGWNFDGTMQIKLHGNSTLMFPKKPYKIKLDSKAALLGMPSDKEWILLANYSDKTLMRNYVAFEVSKRIGLPYTPRSSFVELFMNGVYQGNYQLTEQVKIAANRVDIKEMDETDTTGDKLTGGYLVETNGKLDKDYPFTTTRGVPFTVQDPDPVAKQLAYISNYFQQTEDAIYSDSFTDPTIGYAHYINTDTFVKWYLVNELFKNNDATFYGSVNLYKDRKGILCLGPVWDFDISAGNINYGAGSDPEGWWVKTAPWLSRLHDDPAFSQKVKDQWTILRHELLTIGPFIDETAATLKRSQYNNFKKWDILNTYVWPNAVVEGSYQAEVTYFRTWMANRIYWMDGQLSN